MNSRRRLTMGGVAVLVTLRAAACAGASGTVDQVDRVDSRTAYLPTQWNRYSAGHPIRIVGAEGAHLASVRSAVNGVGGNRGLVEERLPR